MIWPVPSVCRSGVPQGVQFRVTGERFAAAALHHQVTVGASLCDQRIPLIRIARGLLRLRHVAPSRSRIRATLLLLQVP